ncbi:MAG: hypothetical protein HY863_10600 [Chloroflexi bacterium]|nr:hypothetical protein [Chloroflexota bacterium]
MKNIVYLILILLFAIILDSCAKATSLPVEPASQRIEEMINPGDIVGNFLITTGADGDVTYGFDLNFYNNKQGDVESFDCKSTVGTKVNITSGIYDDTVGSASTTATPKLNEHWTNFKYELFIEDRPVNLQAFGYIDTLHPMVGAIRFWNVVIIASTPGKITIRESGVMDGDPIKRTTTYIFCAS